MQPSDDAVPTTFFAIVTDLLLFTLPVAAAGTDAGAKAAAGVAAYELLRGDEGQAFGRIVVNLSMLSDHYLSSYVKGLRALETQWAAETSEPAQ